MIEPKMVQDEASLYHSKKLLSNSGIGKLLKCPALYHAWQEGQTVDEDSPALRLGTFFHSMTLEPQTVDVKYHFLQSPGTTKAGKEERKTAEADGLTCVTMTEALTVKSMATAVHNQPYVGRLFTSGKLQAETSIYWTELSSGGLEVDCKARVDGLIHLPDGHVIAIDLKSAQSADPAELGRKVYNFGYHRQAAWYTHALAQVGVQPSAFIFVFVEKSAPWLVTPVVLTEDAIALGWDECQRAVEICAECQQSGVWPQYSDKVISLDLPEWVYAQRMRKERNHE